MKSYRVSNWWTAGTFLGSFLFYLLTSCFVLYPGLSAIFTAELLFPEQLPAMSATPLEQLFYKVVLMFAPAGKVLETMLVVNAALGAVVVMSLYRAALAMVRTVALSLGWMDDDFSERGRLELRHVSVLVGMSVAVMGMTMCPLWTSATRLLPNTLLTALASVTLTFAIGVRWRSGAAYLRGEEPKLRLLILTFGSFFLATFTLLVAPTLFPIVLVALFLAGWILVQRDVVARIPYFMASVAGTLSAVFASFACVWLWTTAVAPALEMPAMAMWMAQLTGIVPKVMASFFDFDTVAPMLFFVACAALYFGTFPLSYYRFGKGAFGQFFILVLFTLTYVMWPQELAEMTHEPPALLTVSVSFLVVLVGLMMGSWVRAWYDSHATLPKRRVNLIAVVIAAVVCSGVTVGNVIVHAKSAAGRGAQETLEEMWVALDETLPEHRTLWWRPEPELYGVLAHRALNGNAIQPVYSPKGMVNSALDPTGLYAVSPRAYLTYCVFAKPEVVQAGPLPMGTAEQLAKVTETLAATEFATTVVGQRTVRLLGQQAARAYVTQAYEATPEEANRLLHLAKALDPENIGVILGLGALAEEGVMVSAEEGHEALALRESDLDYRDPTPETAIKFMRQHGPVRMATFREADRLHRLQYVSPESMIAQITAMYREAPSQLSTYERCLAVLYLPEAEVGAALLAGEPTVDELRLYLALYPWTELSEQLWEKYKTTALSEAEGVVVLRRTRKEGTRKQLLDRALTFFLRDGRFAYALFYVNGLLEDGHIEDAAEFVGGFNIQSRLKARPHLAEMLRLRVAEALYKQDGALAVDTLNRWLMADPYQPLLWSYYFTHSTFPSPAYVQAAAGRCLNVYPFHAAALEALKGTLPAETGATCIGVLNAAREVILNDKEAYAHR